MAAPSDRHPLVLLYGGVSAEHEISCISGRWALSACTGGPWDLAVVGIGSDGRWVDATAAALAADPGGHGLPDPDDLLAAGGAVLDPWEAVRPGQGAVVWPVLHGPMGEDGTVQGLLELAGTAYVGASVAGSAAAMDKALAKAALAGAGVPQARWFAARVGSRPAGAVEAVATRIDAELGWPAYVKPANMGSSIGVHRVAGPADLAGALEDAAAYDEDVVVEEEVRGREIEVAVLGDEPRLRVSRPGEVVPSSGVYDFDDKYRNGTAELRVPVELPGPVEAELGRLARSACRALRVEHMARADFFYVEDAEEGRRLLVNEVNTLPGLTPISMYPALWAASGVPAAALAAELVGLARARRARRDGRRTRRAG